MNTADPIDYKELYEELSVKYEALKHELEALKKLIYGSKQERFVPSHSAIAQLSLDIQAEAVEQTNTVTQKVEYTRCKVQDNTTTKVATGRMKLPESLPKERVVIEPLEDVSGLRKIGEEGTEELELIEAKLYVKQYVRPKYVKESGEKVS